MIITPTATSGAAAGFGFWMLIWLIILKIDKIPLFNSFLQTKRIILWVQTHKAQAMIGTEVTNLAMHAGAIQSPNLMTFVLGGTLFNGIMIYALITPISWWLNRDHEEVIK